MVVEDEYIELTAYERIVAVDLQFPDEDEDVLPASAKDLIRGILRQNPRERLSLDDICNHPFMKEFYNTKTAPKATTAVNSRRMSAGSRKFPSNF